MSRSPSPRVRPALLAAAWLAALPLQAAASEASAASHCTADEQTLFACSTGRKRLSVCASAQLTRDAGSVQYRFGAPGRSPFVLPAADAGWRATVRGGGLMFSGGGGAYLAFANPPYRYVVYSAIGRGWGSRAGVVVEKHGRRIASLPCVGATASTLGPDLFERAGIAEDPLGFELP
ncbi:MAG TPA: hypothetical protein PKC97_03370 [Burkholderiaceae bacterium]|nr:hypothetical protein [Burkholderiaceae bacterium]